MSRSRGQRLYGYRDDNLATQQITSRLAASDMGALELHVKPKSAQVYVDGREMGEARGLRRDARATRHGNVTHDATQSSTIESLPEPSTRFA